MPLNYKMSLFRVFLQTYVSGVFCEVFFCWEGKSVKPDARGRYVVKTKNLIPKQDLKILMLEPYKSVFAK